MIRAAPPDGAVGGPASLNPSPLEGEVPGIYAAKG